MKIKINVNESVKVKLNDIGRELHRKDHEAFWKGDPRFPYKAPKEDSDGYSSWSFWYLMQAFGPHIYLGMVVPFDTDIIYDSSNL